jgi:hypothetical protein
MEILLGNLSAEIAQDTFKPAIGNESCVKLVIIMRLTSSQSKILLLKTAAHCNSWTSLDGLIHRSYVG